MEYPSLRYIVRLNPKAYNILTKRIDAGRIWEVEQVGNKDSEKVIWHCSDVKIDEKPIQKLFPFPKPGEKPVQMEFSGIAMRDGYHDAILISTIGRHEVSA